MDSVHFKKNPVMGQMYWNEVCRKEAKGHLFHPSSGGVTGVDRSTPFSSYQRSFAHGRNVRV